VTELTPQERAEVEARDLMRAAQRQHGPALPNLLTPEDPDWDKYQNDEPEWFLRAAGRAIRKFCGWQLYPNIPEQRDKIRIGSRGIIMLPSRFVTAVDHLSIRYTEPHQDPHPLGHGEYTWYEAGWVELKGFACWQDWYLPGFYYGNDPYYLPITQPGIASVKFWHGYDVLPDDIKEVAFELAEQAMAVRTGNIKMLEAPGGYRAQTSQPFGLSLNPDQKCRLGNYRIGMVG
jgi:hypothetical protein